MAEIIAIHVVRKRNTAAESCNHVTVRQIMVKGITLIEALNELIGRDVIYAWVDWQILTSCRR